MPNMSPKIMRFHVLLRQLLTDGSVYVLQKKDWKLRHHIFMGQYTRENEKSLNFCISKIYLKMVRLHILLIQLSTKDSVKV